MSLRGLIYSTDSTFANTFSSVAKEFDCEHWTVKNGSELTDTVERERFDFVVFDLGSSKDDPELLRSLKKLSANRELITIVGATNERSCDVIAMGASVVVYKPVDESIVKRQMGDVLRIATTERRAYERFPVAVPAKFQSKVDGTITGFTFNLGGGGVALALESKPQTRDDAQVSFCLPGHTEEVVLEGSVVWADTFGRLGLRFNQERAADRERLATWLNQRE